MSLEKLAQDINRNPDRADHLLDDYLMNHSGAAEIHNLRAVAGQLSKAQALFQFISADFRDTKSPIFDSLIETESALLRSISGVQHMISLLEQPHVQ